MVLREGESRPGLFDLRIGQIEIVLPGGSVEGFLPAGGDEITSRIELPFEALRKARGISPHLPDAISQTHLVHARNSPVVVVEHVISGVRIIRADDPGAAGEMFDKKSPTFQPVE